MSQQEFLGKTKKTQGKVKEAVGILSSNKKLEKEGTLERAEGAVQEAFGTARRKAGDLLANIGHAIKK